MLWALAAAESSSPKPATTSSPPKPLCSKAGCPWDTLPYNCTSTQLQLTFRTTLHYSGVVNCGSLFVDIDLGAANDEHTYPEHAYYTPDMKFAPATPNKLYTCALQLRAVAPARARPSGHAVRINHRASCHATVAATFLGVPSTPVLRACSL